MRKRITKAIRSTTGILACGVLMLGMTSGCNNEQNEPAQILVTYPNCENVEYTPCITFDDGEWRKVTSYDPYCSYEISQPRTVGDRFEERS